MKALLVAALAALALSDYPDDRECPEDCDCHYFRVNYVTDCSEGNFTEIPVDEISRNAFILDMNGESPAPTGAIDRAIIACITGRK